MWQTWARVHQVHQRQQKNKIKSHARWIKCKANMHKRKSNKIINGTILNENFSQRIVKMLFKQNVMV